MMTSAPALQILFSREATLPQRCWVTSGERRRSGVQTDLGDVEGAGESGFERGGFLIAFVRLTGERVVAPPLRVHTTRILWYLPSQFSSGGSNVIR